MGPARPHSQAAEDKLSESVKLTGEIKALERSLAEKRAARRDAWLDARDAPDSAVTRQRIADACAVSIFVVDDQLRAAKKERE